MSDSFIGMVMSKVDPFAVYRAEKRLRAEGIHVDRIILVNHYTLGGDLGEAVDAILAPRNNDEPELSPAELIAPLPVGKDQKLVNPLAWGFIYAATVLVLAVVGRLGLLAAPGAFADPKTKTILAVAFGFILGMCFVYAFLASWIGRR